MASIVIVGAGVCGLASAMMLARDGHGVTVLERDSAAVPESPEDAWECWERGGVSQFRQAHYLHPRSRHVLEAELPDVLEALLAAGGLPLNDARFAGDTRPGDERHATVTARRTTLEHVVGRAAAGEPRVDVRRGVAISALTTRNGSGVPHVTGVRTEDGEELRADLVIDAMGRRSRLPAWLAAAGAETPVHEEAEDSGFIYYSRFFTGTIPRPHGPLLNPLGTFSLLTLPSDRGTWSVTVFIAAGDRPLKALRDPSRFTALVRACPLHAHWLDGEPLSGVEAMGGVLDRVRRIVVDGEPVATGVLPVADAWACTNPSLGRGIALGLAHVQLLPAVVREHLEQPRELVRAWDEATERELAPWYRATVAGDRTRLAEMDALRHGLQPPQPSDGPAMLWAALPKAMAMDPDVFRAGLELMGVLTLPQDVFARPGLAERVLRLAAEADEPPRMAPARDELLGLVAA